MLTLLPTMHVCTQIQFIYHAHSNQCSSAKYTLYATYKIWRPLVSAMYDSNIDISSICKIKQ